MIFYSKEKSRLIYIKEQATKDFWTKHWKSQFNDKRFFEREYKNSFPVRITQKYLSAGSKVLDGGCGSGVVPMGHSEVGYHGIGVDFSEETINFLNTKNLTSDFIIGDVFDLNKIQSCEMDGYWSLGVIEHFWDGYGKIIEEAHRVLKVDGYLFLTFPSFSPLRKLKAKMSRYPRYNEKGAPEHFYQFALDKSLVAKELLAQGFDIKKVQGLDAVKGLKDDIRFLKPVFQSLYNSKSFGAKVLRFILSKAIANYVGHITLIVAKKK